MTKQKTIEEIIDEVSEKAEKIGALREQNRILNELVNINLPIGVWPLIRSIICPPKL